MYTLNANFPQFVNEVLATEKRVLNARPAVNIRENDTAFFLELAAPGLLKEDFDIQSENGVLSISVDKKQEEEVKYFKQEFEFNTFKRSFKLPNNVDLVKIQASYKDGILVVNLPKREELKAKKVEVLVG
ncbi:Hsp20/alpha crystallin family protein [Sediminitomix flava]|nr:Hsp20/alpha crystallin family protein [Sediminitomix flava]